jgi:hypothetical protein
MDFALQFIKTMIGSQGVSDPSFFPTLSTDSMLMTQLICGMLAALPVYGLLRRTGLTILRQSIPVAALAAVAAGACRLALFSALLYFVLITIAAQAYHPFLYFQF